ncbi:AMP-binding enzyme [Ralstonia syzygii]|uniref:AMP-binding enzyme n=1 Tax=Ralstonia syzygii TaxID=28097 RepID=UPI0022B1E9C7|nr:AMP-binding protein [Ralstonia syzygii]
MQYVNAPELDARYRNPDGWVRTGDLGLIDSDGYLVLAGRKKDIIIRGGTNISPEQIESLVTGYPNVVSAACVPVPDPDLGQRVCLCLALRDGAERPPLSDINAYLRRQGAGSQQAAGIPALCTPTPAHACREGGQARACRRDRVCCSRAGAVC